MNTQGVTTTFSVDPTPEAVFDAISNVRGWWLGEIERKLIATGGGQPVVFA